MLTLDRRKKKVAAQRYTASLLDKAKERAGDDEALFKLPTLYGLQEEITQDPAKRKVIVAGRRFGKTLMCSRLAITKMIEGKRVLLSSTSQDQADAFWEYIEDWCSDAVATGKVYKNSVRRIMKFGKGFIRVKTGRHPDALRSGWADLVVLDECAFLDPDAWRKVVSPMLADTEGDCYFISTPNRRNWFYHLYQQAINGKSETWKAWNFPTTANPYISKRALELLVEDMTEEDYQQEILAQFLEGEGSVFRNIMTCATARTKPPSTGDYVFGIDWGDKGDYTVVTVMDVHEREVVAYERFNRTGWRWQRSRIEELNKEWTPRLIVAEENSIGSVNIEELEASGLPIQRFNTTAKSKPPLIESLVLAFENEQVRIPNDSTFVGEFLAYEKKVSNSGHKSYNAPEGMHDDIVISTALAWNGMQHYHYWDGEGV